MFKSVVYPPVPAEYALYVHLSSVPRPKTKLQKSIDSLQHLTQITPAPVRSRSWPIDSPPSRTYALPQHRWAEQYIQELADKRDFLISELTKTTEAQIDLLTKLCSELVNASVSFELDLDNLSHKIHSEVFCDPKVVKYNRKIQSLTSYLENAPMVITSRQLKKAFHESVPLIHKDFSVFPTTPFDSALYPFFTASGFDAVVGPIGYALQEGSHVPMTDMYKKLCTLFDVKTTEERILVRTSLMRVAFDSIVSVLDAVSPQFLRNSRVISRLTPREISLVTPLITEVEMDLPLCDISLFHSHLFAGLCFLSNPLDILSALYKVERLLCNDSTLHDFDDFFCLYFAALAVNPPLNSVGIADSLALLTGLKIPSNLEHAMTSFIGAVKYIEGFTEMKHPAELKTRIAELTESFPIEWDYSSSESSSM